MPSSLLPGRGWRASWKAGRANVDSSAARAGTRFAAAWFSLCRCEERVLTALHNQEGRLEMPIILWLLGVPIVVIVLLYLLNIV